LRSPSLELENRDAAAGNAHCYLHDVMAKGLFEELPFGQAGDFRVFRVHTVEHKTLSDLVEIRHFTCEMTRTDRFLLCDSGAPHLAIGLGGLQWTVLLYTHSSRKCAAPRRLSPTRIA
jgi:hypothetical protein